MAALTWVSKLALAVCLFGLKAFVFGIVAEDRKPPPGSRVGVMCQFPAAAADVAVVTGILSVVSLVLATALGHVAALYPYKGSISHNYTNPNVPAAAAPRGALFQRTSFVVFFLITELVSASALAMLLWATIAQGRHRNVQYQLQYDGHDMEEDTTTCGPLPAAKTSGLFGGGALLALDATLLWLVCQMLALDARADYLDLHGDGDDDADGNKVGGD